MDFAKGFGLWRPLGLDAQGDALSFQALTAIHYSHRLFAYVVFVYLGVLSWRLRHVLVWNKPIKVLVGLLLLQLVTGLSNVVLGWPLLAAVLHTGGAAALCALLVWMLTGVRRSHDAV
jgi:cytochrome c oxidase assembly protein subunit 15